MKIFKNTQLIFFCSAIFFCLQFQAQNNSTNLENQTDSIFSKFKNLSKPGLAISIIDNGKVVYSKGFGSSSLEYDIPITPLTVFHIASVSKQFTVFSILLLEEQGKLSLDDDVRKYIHEMPDYGETITLRHLASHTSGLRDQGYLLGLAGWRDDDIQTNEQVMHIITNHKELNFKPGDKYAYSNSGFTLLAEVVSRVSGQTFAEYAKSNIFIPLKMFNTQIKDDYEKIIKNRASSYHLTSTGYKKSILNVESVGSTNLNTTIEDMSLWSLNFSKFTIGSPTIIKKMDTPYVLNNGKALNPNGGWRINDQKLGLGQFLDKYKGLNEIYHAGGDAGYRAYFTRFPEQNFSVIIFANSSEIQPYILAAEVTDLYLKNDLKNSSKEKPTTINNIVVDSIQYSPSELNEFSGKYYNKDLQTTYHIVAKENNLEIHHLRIGIIKMHSIEKDLFQDYGEWDYGNFKFVRDSFGKIVEMRFSGGGRVENVKFEKIE
jgi:CubicO group peptidase (beta-lactamase class C family)